MEEILSDILIIGGGAAGCFAAIKAKQSGVDRVILADKGYVGKSGCSKFAAGSFKCFIPGEDEFDLWFSKAVEEGCYINDQTWTRIHLEEVFDRARELEAWGLDFLKDEKGRYQRLEGQGSSEKRPIKTMMFRGPQLMDVLRRAARKSSVEIMDKVMITHLLHHKKDCNTIAEALGLAMEFAGDDKLVVALGDNILQKGIGAGVEAFAQQDRGSRIFLKEVEHPWEYGIAEVTGDRIERIIEKPEDPPSNLAVIGVYMYPPGVFDIVKGLKPSARGELEITDVNNAYIERGEMQYEILDGWWLDAGENHEALLHANLTVAREAGIDV